MINSPGYQYKNHLNFTSIVFKYVIEGHFSKQHKYVYIYLHGILFN